MLTGKQSLSMKWTNQVFAEIPYSARVDTPNMKRSGQILLRAATVELRVE